jgi:hypothetical protein
VVPIAKVPPIGSVLVHGQGWEQRARCAHHHSAVECRDADSGLYGIYHRGTWEIGKAVVGHTVLRQASDWVSWCIPYKQENPALAAVWERYRTTADVVLIGVLYQDSVEAARDETRAWGTAGRAASTTTARPRSPTACSGSRRRSSPRPTVSTPAGGRSTAALLAGSDLRDEGLERSVEDQSDA